MPITHNNSDYSPLVIDNEIIINNETLLAEYVGRIVLGHFAHVKRIILALSNTVPMAENSDIDLAIGRLISAGKSSKDIEKRDGWLFQIISWLALFTEKSGQKFYCQQPHDAPAQHGLDGVAIILDDQLVIKDIIISEDKCTDDSHRVLIPKIWEEFKQFENGDHNNKLVSRISAMIENLADGSVLEANHNNIYNKDLWRYRVGITRVEKYQDEAGRKSLFKGYDGCVLGTTPHRRFASTLHNNDIRDWMEKFSIQVITYLESQKTKNV